MNTCNSWVATGTYPNGIVHRCIGTKECDMCECGGDRSRCDFYENVRKEARFGKEGCMPEVIQSPADIRAGMLIVMRELESGKTYNLTVNYNASDELGCANYNPDMVVSLHNSYDTIDMEDNFFNVKSLTPEFEYRGFPPGSILAVVEAIYGRSNNKYLMHNTTHGRQLLWKRPETKKMTVSEIEKILGYKIEVVAEK